MGSASFVGRSRFSHCCSPASIFRHFCIDSTPVGVESMQKTAKNWSFCLLGNVNGVTGTNNTYFTIIDDFILSTLRIMAQYSVGNFSAFEAIVCSEVF